MPNFLRFLKSLKLSVILIALLILLGVLGGIIPQKRSVEFYQHSFPGTDRIITGTGLDHVFTSIIFLTVSGLFFVNLVSCTFFRFLKERSRLTGRRHAPDVIHLGIIVLFIGGIVTLAGRRETLFFLAPGEGLGMPGGYRIEVVDLIYESYADGRPKDWITRVRIYRDGDRRIRNEDIEVNKPLKLGRYRIYQAMFSRERGLTGFTVVYDPGFVVILIGLVLAGGGLFLTYFSRLIKEDG